MIFCTFAIWTILSQAVPTIKTVDGGTVLGTISFADNTKWIMQTSMGNKMIPMDQILGIDFGEKPKAPVAFCEITLNDGSKLRGTSFIVKGETLELTTFENITLSFPISKLTGVLRQGQDASLQADWKDRINKTRRRDVLAIARKDKENPEKMTINGLEGTLGKGSEDGKTIGFTPASGKNELPVPQANLHGLLWLRGPDASLLAPLGKAEDVHGQLLEVGKIRSASNSVLALTLACGVDLDLPVNRIVRLDFSRGKLAWLSDMDWQDGAVTGFEDRLDRVRRNTNLDGGALKLGGVPYSRGLAIPAPSSLSYSLGGEYRELQALVGLDDGTGSAEGTVRLRLEGDGKLLVTLDINGTNRAKPEKLSVNLKDVQVLKIVVESPDLSPFGRHLIIANPKVSR